MYIEERRNIRKKESGWVSLGVLKGLKGYEGEGNDRICLVDMN